MSDLYGWIIEQVAMVEGVARDATAGPWAVAHPEERWEAYRPPQIIGQGKPLATMNSEYNGPLNAEHIALNGPDAVLRRCTADRKLLEVHKPLGEGWDPYACEGCGYDGSHCPELITKHANDCPVLLAVAEGYGLTEEILAGLDRPQKGPAQPADSSPIGRAASAAWGPALMSSLTNGLVLRPSQDETGA